VLFTGNLLCFTSNFSLFIGNTLRNGNFALLTGNTQKISASAKQPSKKACSVSSCKPFD